MPDFTMDHGSRAGVPIAYNFTFGGAAVDWGTKYLLEMGDVTCRSEPLDGMFSVSELQTTFSDTNGSIWGSLGHGTTCLGSSWAATCYVGGVLIPYTYGAVATGLQRTAGNNSGTFVAFTGRITDVKRINRKVEITAKNAMAQVEDLEWQFPVARDRLTTGVDASWSSSQGSNFFFTDNFITGYPSAYGSSYFSVSSDKTQFELFCYVGTGQGAELQTLYPPQAGRGTMGETITAFKYLGTKFYEDYDKYLFKGSFLGTYVGNITEDGQAQSFGFSSAAAAVPTGGSYIINKTRLVLSSDNTPAFTKGSIFYAQQAGILLASDPATLWREMLTGCCVTPLFGTVSVDVNTFATSQRNVAFQAHSQNIDPRGGKVLPFIKDLLEPQQAQWAVGVDNTFKLFTYGPKLLNSVVGTLGSSEIISSELSSSISDKINRVILNYAYSFTNGSYSQRIERKGSFWGSTNDSPKTFSSKWLANTNNANIVVNRTLNKLQNGVPKLQLKVPLSRLGADVGSIYSVEDTDCLTGGKPFEVTAWRHDFANDRSVTLNMWDGVSLYQRGYAKWEGDSNLSAAVSGTSLSGWGTQGTVHNINAPSFGSVFAWF